MSRRPDRRQRRARRKQRDRLGQRTQVAAKVIEDPRHVLFIDSITGHRYVPVNAMLRVVRERFDKPDLTKAELIRRMAEINVRFEYVEGTNPDDPTDRLGVDLFRLPDDFELQPRRAA